MNIYRKFCTSCFLDIMQKQEIKRVRYVKQKRFKERWEKKIRWCNRALCTITTQRKKRESVASMTKRENKNKEWGGSPKKGKARRINKIGKVRKYHKRWIDRKNN